MASVAPNERNLHIASEYTHELLKRECGMEINKKKLR